MSFVSCSRRSPVARNSRARQKEAPQRRQRHRLDTAVEQLAAELLFKLSNLHADRCGRDVHALGRAGQSACADHLAEATNLVDLHLL